VKLRGFSVFYDFFEGYVFMKPNMIKKWSIALLVAAGATGLTGCEGMRVDDGASTATNNGNIAVSPNGAALKGNLSGTVTNDFGTGVSGVTVYSYGRQTTTDAGGNWILENVPVTGININSTAQNLEQTTDVVSQGNIYISYSKPGYAEYKSRISNPGVITHYGTAGGNPNSIVVDGLIASEAIQLPLLVNTITGVLVNKASYFSDPVGEYAMASGISVRLIPAVDVVNNAYDSEATVCYEGCGFYSVEELQATTGADGTFSFTKVPKIPGGYIMRVDDPKYRPMARPNDGTGFSYDYDAGTLGTLANPDSPWGVSVQAHENQNYWWGIDFDVKTQSGATTFLDTLYVGDYLVATLNVVEGITVGGKYGFPDEASGETSDDGHNALDAALDPNNDNIIDSNIVDLGVTPLKFVFSGDMIPHKGSEIPTNAIVVFDNNGNQLTWDATATSVSGRTLSLQLASTPNAGSTIFIRLHRDVFADMDGTRLTQTVDPNNATFTSDAGPTSSDPANDLNYYTEYSVVYVNPLITAAQVQNVVQASINRAIPLTRSLTLVGNTAATAIGARTAPQTSMTSLQASDARVEELVDAMLVRATATTAINVDTDAAGATAAGTNDDNRVTFVGNAANISFTAVNGGNYRVTVLDDNGITLTVADTTATQATATDTATGGAGATALNLAVGNNATGSTFLDFTASVGAAGSSTATIQLTNVAAGFIVTISRINDFGDVISASASQTVTLADDFEPHVAIQNSNFNGQDTVVRQVSPIAINAAAAVGALGTGNINSDMTSEMLFQCGIETSDDNGEAEVGDAAYFFPKLNLSASLYDKSNLRAHTEAAAPADLLSTAMDQGQAGFTQAEDFNNALTGALLVQALGTPLLSTTPATETTFGTTDNTSRNDEYYNAADYTGWGLQQVVSATPACTYYMGDLNNVTGTFSGSWYPSDAAGIPTSVTPVADDDNNAATVPPALANFTVSGTYPFTLIGGGATTGTLLKESAAITGCDAGATSQYDFSRTVVLNMTESVVAPTDLAAFMNQTGVCGQTNIVSTSELASSTSGITAISDRSAAYNNDHLLLTFGDWRTIDDSNHFTSNQQNLIANDLSEGSSLNDLMQIVTLADASGITATAGNGRGVLIVDATPAMATVLSHDGLNLTMKFDQSIRVNTALTTAGAALNEFVIEGEGGSTYTFNLGTTAAAPTQGTVSRDTAYVDRYGSNVVAANTPVDITVVSAVNPDANVPAGNANSMVTITMSDPATGSGSSSASIRGVDFSDYFNEMSYNSANAASGLSSVATATMLGGGFFMNYDNLQDNNFNSWTAVETYDQYDGANGPRILGVDGQGPQLTAVTQLAAAAAADLSGRETDATYLHASTGIAVTSLHVTTVADDDIIYTPAATSTVPIASANGDQELAQLYGYVNGAIAAKGTNTRLVIKTNAANLDISDAVAYIYDVDQQAGAVGGGQGLSEAAGGTFLLPTDASVVLTGGTFSQAGALQAGVVASSGSTLVVELPALATPTAGDFIVIQNLVVEPDTATNANDGHVYSIHIPIPAAQALTAAGGTAPATTEATTLTNLTSPPVVYKHVYLGGAANDTSNITAIKTGTNFTSATASASIDFNFQEPLATAVTATWSRGDDDDGTGAAALADVNTVDFGITPAVSTAANSQAATADAEGLSLTMAGNVAEGTTDHRVGHDATLTVNLSDHSGNPSSFVVRFQKGHGELINNGLSAGEDGQAVLNIISGSAID
jgi:hypothetical protein